MEGKIGCSERGRFGAHGVTKSNVRNGGRITVIDQKHKSRSESTIFCCLAQRDLPIASVKDLGQTHSNSFSSYFGLTPAALQPTSAHCPKKNLIHIFLFTNLACVMEPDYMSERFLTESETLERHSSVFCLPNILFLS